MEFLRFGSSIPGTYWGCCAMDIIQNFNFEPDSPSSIQIVNGDAGAPIMNNGASAFVGKTYHEIFLQRLRFGTFDKRDMPNHGFIAILTENQINSSIGLKWLKILKETGFEFIRTVSNSVYTGASLGTSGDRARNYVFALFRNIGDGNTTDPFTPPEKWSELDAVVPEFWASVPEDERKKLAEKQRTAQKLHWDALPPQVLYSAKRLEELKVPVIMAGIRSQFPQQSKAERQAVKAVQYKQETKAKADQFGCAASKPAAELADIPL